MPEYTFKLIVIGDGKVGKTCLWLRGQGGHFENEHRSTIAAGVITRSMVTTNGMVKLDIWDTAGQEIHRALARSYFRGTAGVLLVYDISNRESFTNLKGWLDDVQLHCSDTTTVLLIGNKTDLRAQRQVWPREARRFAVKNGLLFKETSAKNNIGVEDALVELAQNIHTKVGNGTIDVIDPTRGVRSTNATLTPAQNASGCCF